MKTELVAPDTGVIRRGETIATLKRIFPTALLGVEKLQELAMKFSHAEWKELFIRYWQQQSRNAAELESKIRELGGDVDSELLALIEPVSTGDTKHPLSMDRSLLMNALNGQTQLLQAYAQARHMPVAFDVRMLLQRHQLQTEELTQKLSEAVS